MNRKTGVFLAALGIGVLGILPGCPFYPVLEGYWLATDGACCLNATYGDMVITVEEKGTLSATYMTNPYEDPVPIDLHIASGTGELGAFVGMDVLGICEVYDGVLTLILSEPGLAQRPTGFDDETDIFFSESMVRYSFMDSHSPVN